MTGTVDNAVEEIKNFFHTLQTSENWFRFGVTFSTQEKYYFLDTGTGKIFRVNQQVYRVLECILKTNNFENLSYLGMTEEELLLALKEIEKAVKEEHILQAPPVTGMVYYKEDIENSLDHAMQAVTLEITERCNLRCDYCMDNLQRIQYCRPKLRMYSGRFFLAAGPVCDAPGRAQRRC